MFKILLIQCFVLFPSVAAFSSVYAGPSFRNVFKVLRMSSIDT